MKKMRVSLKRVGGIAVVGMTMGLVLAGCSGDRVKNQAMEAAARYWSDKAYPGKSFDVQVTEASKDNNGNYLVKGIVDGETRVGTFNPESETFSEGYYSLAHEREKRIAELEQQVKYWKEKSEDQDKQIYKLNFELRMARGEKAKDQTDDGTAAGTQPASVDHSADKSDAKTGSDKK